MLSQLLQGWLARDMAQDASGGRITLENENMCFSKGCDTSPGLGRASWRTHSFYQLSDGGKARVFPVLEERFRF